MSDDFLLRREVVRVINQIAASVGSLDIESQRILVLLNDSSVPFLPSREISDAVRQLDKFQKACILLERAKLALEHEQIHPWVKSTHFGVLADTAQPLGLFAEEIGRRLRTVVTYGQVLDAIAGSYADHGVTLAVQELSTKLWAVIDNVPDFATIAEPRSARV